MVLYALCDYETLVQKNITLEEFVKICQIADAKIIQYRDKSSDAERKRQNLLMLRALWEKTLIVNDELALVDLCDGVHLGQEDLRAIDSDKKRAAFEVRKRIGQKIFGLSTHSEEEVLEANTLPVDYIGLGAYRRSTTKSVHTILGDRISQIASLCVHPVAAIGGVRLDDKISNVTYLVVGSGLLELGQR